jgi:hypothetical protein
MINTIIFSKNRACQLDLTLATLKKYFKEWKEQEYTIIFRATDLAFVRAYERVRELHPEFKWVEEHDFRTDTLAALNGSTQPWVSFVVDDDVFVDYFSIEDKPFKVLASNPYVACVSPRLAPHISFCYTRNGPQPAPVMDEHLGWNWITAVHDWNYPMSIASFHTFRKEDLLFLNQMGFRGPNTLEGGMEGHAPRHRPAMICFETVKCIVDTSNKVQIENANHCSNTHSLEELNFGFLSGKRLSTNANHQLKIAACHGPLNLVWE